MFGNRGSEGGDIPLRYRTKKTKDGENDGLHSRHLSRTPSGGRGGAGTDVGQRGTRSRNLSGGKETWDRVGANALSFKKVGKFLGRSGNYGP